MPERRTRSAATRRLAAGLAAVAAGAATFVQVGASPAGAASAASPAVPSAYASAVSTPKVDSYYPDYGSAVVDALHYQLDLTWNQHRRTLQGRERLVFRAARTATSVPLDLSEHLAVSRVAVDGHAVTPSRSASRLSLPVAVRAGTVHTVDIVYAGTPRPVKPPTTRTDEEALGFITRSGGRAYTMQEPYGAFTWFAVNDQPADKALYDFTLHVPAPFVGVANGRLLGRRTAGGVTTTRWHLDEPAASYLTTVAFDRFRHTSLGKVNGTPISSWTPANRPGLVKKLRFMPRAFRWLERQLGRYPFDTLSLVVVPSRSAMETQTMITEGSTKYTLQQDTIVHEMSHQWYGDQVTPNDWRDVWMSEGMAMYVQYRWEEQAEGATPGSLLDYDTTYYDNSLRKTYGAPGAYDPLSFASSNVYLPPARMWWRLSQRLGHAKFNRLLRKWPATHAHTSTSREALADWWSNRSGQDLHGFFRQWLLAKSDPS
jgi:aminopeptidase N